MLASASRGSTLSTSFCFSNQRPWYSQSTGPSISSLSYSRISQLLGSMRHPVSITLLSLEDQLGTRFDILHTRPHFSRYTPAFANLTTTSLRIYHGRDGFYTLNKSILWLAKLYPRSFPRRHITSRIADLLSTTARLLPLSSYPPKLSNSSF